MISRLTSLLTMRQATQMMEEMSDLVVVRHIIRKVLVEEQIDVQRYAKGVQQPKVLSSLLREWITFDSILLPGLQTPASEDRRQN